MKAVFAKRHFTTTYGNTYVTLTGAYGAAAKTNDKLIKLFGTLTGHLRTLTGLQKNWACCMTHVRPHLRETLTGAYGTAAGTQYLSWKSAYAQAQRLVTWICHFLPTMMGCWTSSAYLLDLQGL